MDIQLEVLTVVFSAFFIAGIVKGVVGLGLPPLVLGIITATMGLHAAMALVALPALLTNLVQGLNGPYLKALTTNHVVFFFTATTSVFLGSWVSTSIGGDIPSIILGAVLVAYAVSGLFKLRINLREAHEPIAGITAGTCNGILTGITGSSAVPGVFYLQSIGLNRDQLIQSMGILFSLSAITLAMTLYWRGYLNFNLGILSILSLIPAFFGMAVGSAIRKRMPAAAFLPVFFISLLLLGVYIVVSKL
ncbi:sulfite exporter TauE/SafE family protein [Halomonas sp. ANAO-440]|uniref:sulfite exporter TauE/SafE family protein n=1 Tax=Halomonas sp. ANAO-440 TaxID=2861360 RepID=UPI001CAA7940|nr:sulfite exporter TauE/SafE family protein [Halomonas sp. ANAO-440]MBZ0331370.1 sulfite exporter TauE/SafE family protein [Halomonas sp. ANAO-440]